MTIFITHFQRLGKVMHVICKPSMKGVKHWSLSLQEENILEPLHVPKMLGFFLDSPSCGAISRFDPKLELLDIWTSKFLQSRNMSFILKSKL